MRKGSQLNRTDISLPSEIRNFLFTIINSSVDGSTYHTKKALLKLQRSRVLSGMTNEKAPNFVIYTNVLGDKSMNDRFFSIEKCETLILLNLTGKK